MCVCVFMHSFHICLRKFAMKSSSHFLCREYQTTAFAAILTLQLLITGSARCTPFAAGLKSSRSGIMPLSQEVKTALEQFIKQAENGGHVAAMSNMFQYLKAHNLCYTHRVNPSLVHVHPQNRDGIGVYPTEVRTLLSDIGDAGWSWSEVKAIATEVPSLDRSVEDFNRQLVANSNGLLPEVRPGTVKYASLSATHTNMVLRLFAAAEKHPDERFTTSGTLSMEKLSKHDPAFEDAVRHGLHWEILSSEVLVAFPELAGLIQLTANTSGQLQRKETELQLAKRIFGCWQRQSQVNPSGCVSFNDVKRDLMRSKPACMDSLSSLFRFVLQFGGGTSADYLNETVRVCSACRPKTLGNEFWTAILTQPRILVCLFRNSFAMCKDMWPVLDFLFGLKKDCHLSSIRKCSTVSSHSPCCGAVCHACTFGQNCASFRAQEALQPEHAKQA